MESVVGTRRLVLIDVKGYILYGCSVSVASHRYWDREGGIEARAKT